MGLKAVSGGAGSQITALPVPFNQGGTNSNSTTNVATSLANSQAVLLPKTRAALGRVKAGNGNARIFFIGDSTTEGTGANGASTGDLKTNSFPGEISRYLNSSGINSHFNSFMCASNGNITSHDTRVTVGSGWTQGVAQALGGQTFTANSTTASITFTPAVNCDTFNFFGIKTAGAGTIAYNLNGSTNTLQSLAGTGLILNTLTTSLGVNTANVNWSSGGSIFFQGIEAYDSSKKWVSVLNCGWNGSASGSWSSESTVFGYAAAMLFMSPDLVIINIGINDWTPGTALATYQANIQTLITQAQAGGADVVLCTPNPTGGTATAATQLPYVNVLYSLAVSNNILLVDLWNRFGTYTLSNTNGMMFDTLHPNGTGYADIAQAIFNGITV